jgi:hypothetical protein
VYAVLKKLESEISWRQHETGQRAHE